MLPFDASYSTRRIAKFSKELIQDHFLFGYKLVHNFYTFTHLLHTNQVSIVTITNKPTGTLKEKSYNFHNYKFFLNQKVYPTTSHNTSKSMSFATDRILYRYLQRSLKIRLAFNNSSIQ